MKFWLVAVSSLVCLWYTARPAAADSIVFIRARDASLWTARPDGTHARAIAKGPMAWPSESASGTVVAQGPGRNAPDGTRGADIWVFDAGGRLDHRIPTPADYSTLSCPTFAPSHVRISPDGINVAYDTWMCDHFTSVWTRVSARTLDWPGQKLGQEGAIVPSWLGSERLLLSSVSRPASADQFVRYRLGAGDNAVTGWFSAGGWASQSYAVASNDGRSIAIVEDDAPDRFGLLPSRVAIKLYAGENAGIPAGACEADIPFGRGFANVSPSFSPDGRRLLFGEPDGIHIASVAGGCVAIRTAPLVLPGATQGYWSAAGSW